MTGAARAADLPGRLHFALAALVCLGLATLRIGGPFAWLGTWLHEISHGLAAIATGGSIVGITLGFDGAGQAVTRGGSAVVTTFCGYAGAPVLAGLLYAAASLRGTASRLAFVVAAIATAGAALRYGQTLGTYVIAGGVAMLLAGLAWIGGRGDSRGRRAGLRLGQYAALLVVIQETIAPLMLLRDGTGTDAARLAEVTWIPSGFWAVGWAAIGCGVLFLLARHGTGRPGRSTAA